MWGEVLRERRSEGGQLAKLSCGNTGKTGKKGLRGSKAGTAQSAIRKTKA